MRRRYKILLVVVGLVLATAGLAMAMAAAGPLLGLGPAVGAGLGVLGGVALALGVLWGARSRGVRAVVIGRFERLGSRLAKGEPGPDGRAQPLSARIAAAMGGLESRRHLPGATVTFLRGSGEKMEAGRTFAWEVHYFSQERRELLRVQVARDADDASAYRVTAEVEHLGKWLETMAPDKQEAAWDALLLRNMEIPADYADSTAVAEAVGAAAAGPSGSGATPAVRSMALAVARPTLEWAPTVFWIVEAEEGGGRFRYYCDVHTTEVLRREQLT